ncbi:hypothetical protein DXG01_012453 [Tephrocybe rancida]|nr:hypothetical protein DXG01_012453 [Tephrocybe rancida]
MTGFAPLPVDGPPSTQKFTGKAFIVGPKWTHLPVITIGLLGVQIFWSVEMGYASPYLISLGLSKSAMSLVFLAGPLSGLFMQPLIGILADTSTSRFGRRRPFMMAGTVVCILAMLLLGYTRGFASIFTTRDSSSNTTLTIVLAVLSIYLIDFSINAVMAMDRALVVDTLPPAAQASGNAWAARMLGIGAVIGFFVGTIPLPTMFPFLGTTELEVLSVIVSILLLAGHTTMAILVKERVLLESAEHSSAKRPNRFVREIKELWSNLLTLPPVIRQICLIQFLRSTPISAPITPDDRDAEATRLGTRALFYSSIIALILNVVLPSFVATSATRTRTQRQRADSRAGGPPEKTGNWAWLRIPERMKVNLGTLWAASHLVLAGCMFATLFTESVIGATVLISVTGFSWAITQWAPFSLLAEAILTTPDPASNAHNSILLSDARTPLDDPEAAGETAVFLPNSDGQHNTTSDDESDLEDGPPAPKPIMLGNHHARVSRLQLEDEDAEWEDVEAESSTGGSGGNNTSGSGLSAKAGIILGIHNVFIVIPQFLVTGLSAVIFAIFDPVQPQAHILPPPPRPLPTTAATLSSNATEVVRMVLKEVVSKEEMAERGGQSNSVVYIFRWAVMALAFNGT